MGELCTRNRAADFFYTAGGSLLGTLCGANARPVQIPPASCGTTSPVPAVTIFDGSGRLVFIYTPGPPGMTVTTFGLRFSYSLIDTQVVRITNIGGGINANVRIAGTTAILGSGSAITLNAAVAQALANSNLSGVRGRILPPVVTTTGIVQSDVITRVSSVLTGRTDVITEEILLGGTSIVNGVSVLTAAVIGPVGQCAGRSSFNMSCEGGIQYSTPAGTTLIIEVFDTALTTTTTIDRTVTSTGLASVDIPIAAYGRAHRGIRASPPADGVTASGCDAHVALKSSVRLKDGKFVSARIAEVEASAARKGEYGFGDDPSRLAHRIEGRLQIINGNDCQGRGSGLASVRLQADVHVTRQRAGVAWTEVGKGKAKRVRIK